VLVYRLAGDGSLEKLATFERAGVPTVARFTVSQADGAGDGAPHDDRFGEGSD